jgi:hypothetical protein
MYLGVEYLQSSSLKTGVSVLLGIVSRLAIMMGYHQDSQIYPQLSTFEGEMRRRVWLLLLVVDCIVAWQTGLPRVIPKGLGNTRRPRNLLDQDFGPTTSVLPLSRPESRTISNITYMLAMEQMLSMASEITESLITSPSSERTIHFKQRLEATLNQIPSSLRKKASDVTATNDDTIIQLFTLEMTYQRARCILHRQYLLNRQENNNYQAFRWECVDAARRILECQSELFQRVLSQPQYRHRGWFHASCSISDSLTAAMVICLELTNQSKTDQSVDYARRAELIQILKSSQELWKASPRQSSEQTLLILWR